jgi:hypothetical protein
MYEISLTFPATSAVTISLHDTGAEQDSSMNAEEAPAAPAPAGNVPVFNTQTNRRMNRAGGHDCSPCAALRRRGMSHRRISGELATLTAQNMVALLMELLID